MVPLKISFRNIVVLNNSFRAIVPLETSFKSMVPKNYQWSHIKVRLKIFKDSF